MDRYLPYPGPLYALSLVCLPLACNGGDNTATEGSTGAQTSTGAASSGGPGDTEQVPIEPKSGTWTYGSSTIVSNSCGGDPPTDPAGNFTLTVTGAGKFTVNDGDFDEAFDCTYSGDSYSCPDRIVGTEKDPNIDATVTSSVDVDGSLLSATEVDGTQTVKLACTGASCALAASIFGYTLPCEYSYTFTATAN